MISLYVDDILIAGSDLSVIESIKHAFTMQYEMKDMGELNYYLGMKVTRTEDYISLDQKAYIKDILKKYAHLVAEAGDREYTTPMERDLKLRKNEQMTQKQLDYVHVFPYQNIIGALLYLSINTRPDISYSVGVLARYCVSPTYRACKAIIRILSYLRSTIDVDIKNAAIY